MRIKRDWSSPFWNFVAQAFFGGLGLILLTFVCFRFGLSLATTGFAYLIFIVLLSLMGSFIGSVFLSITAVGFLNVFFTEPLFSFRVEFSQDIFALSGFLTASLIICGLTTKARKAAEETEASQKALVETIPGLIWSALPDGSRDFHSQPWLELTGLSAKDAIGNGWTTVFHHEDRARVVEDWRRAVATGEPFEVEARERTAKGEYRSMLVRATPFRDAKGNIVKWYGSSTDIEDLKRANFNLQAAYRDLAQREAKIRHLVDANIIGIFIWDSDGRILEANDAFLRIVGYAPEDLAAGRLNWNEMTPPDWQSRGRRTVEELAATGTALPYEKEFFRKDGSRVPVLIGATFIEVGGKEGVAFVLDLTDRKKMEVELRESEERFRDYAEVESDWFWETGPDHRFREFSRTTADLGLPSDLVGKTRWEIAADCEEAPDKWRAHVATLDAHQPFRGFRYRITRSDGSSIYVSASGKPLFDGRAEFLGYRGVAMDVSEEVRAEKALRESEERFRTLMQFSFDVYWETDAQHRFTRQEFVKDLADAPVPGFDLGIGKTRWELPTLEPNEEAWRKHRETLDGHVPFRDFEFARPRPDGGKRYWSVSGLPVYDETGRFTGYRGVGRHITERKQMEEALRQREKEVREIVETIPAMTVTVLPDGSDVFIGKRFSEYSGLAEEEARGSGWQASIHPDDLDLHVAKWREALASGVPLEIETRFRRGSDGEYRWFLARAVPLRDEQGNVLKWYEVLTDIEDRKLAEAVVWDREARIRRLVDANIIGVFTWQVSGHDGAADAVFRDVNDAFLRIVGYDREELVTGSIGQRILTPPEWQDRTRRAMAEMKLTGAFQPYEKEYIHKDGSRVPVLIGAAQFDETSNQGVAFVIDLTDQKRAEASLRERDATVRGLVDANIIGTFTWRCDTAGGTGFRPVFQDVNDAFLRIVGYDREDLPTGTSTWILTPPDWVDRTQRAADEMQLNGAFQPYEKEFIRKDGSRVPVLVGAAQTGDTGVAFVVDLTEQKRAEKALRESEEQWKAVFENNPIMYFMVGETGTILSVNPFGAEQLGYRVDELIGRPVTTVFYEPDREVVQKNAATCFERPGQAMSWELRKVRKNGDMIWVRETARATVINDRPVLLIVCEDITESKRTAEALAEVQTELAHANRVAALGQLTASIAHEVNQPIAGALSSGNAALRWLDMPDLAAARRAIERVIRDATRAGDVINGLRALVKKEPPQSQSFDINEAIHEVIVITRGEAEKNDIWVETQLAARLPLVQGIRVRLQQVILNLIINAIEAVSGVDNGPRELLIKTAQSESGFVSVAVQDSGPGIDPANVERAFVAFYTTKPEGLGMGLSICRSIVEAHGGKLTVAANVPHGTIFQFTVPTQGTGN